MNSDEPLLYPEHFPGEQALVYLRGPAGRLECLLDLPEPEEDCGAIAIICHSLGDDGGTMHGKVVQMIERAMRELGARTVRVNFRGVGLSDGEATGLGQAETEDLISVAGWLRRVRPDDELWCGGFGFGCFVSARAAQKLAFTQLVSVAPPVEDFDFASLPRPACPWLVIQGDEDEQVNPEAVYQWAENLDEPPQLIRMEETDHQFHRRLMDLRGVIKNGLKRQQRDLEEES